MAVYPVSFDVARPEKFDRTQVALRILVVLIVAVLLSTPISLIVYVGLPVLAAILISNKGGEGYVKTEAGRVSGWLRWYLALWSYMAMLADKFPSEKPEEIVRFEVSPAGSPSVGSALLRLIYSIPSALVLAILSIVAGVIWIIAVISVLIQETYPEGLYNFQLGIMRWQARLLGYHASLVEEYPPFAVDTGPEGTPPPAAMESPPRPQSGPEEPTQP